MAILDIKPAETCTYDLLSLGEVMLRLDPGDERIRTARSFNIWEGGGEYNVAKGISLCFGLRSAVVTAFADNELGRLAEGCIRRGGVDVSLVKWVPYDGIGRSVRNGLNFVERGFGIRGALGLSDRGHTAVSQLKKGDIDWENIFGNLGVRWFHTGGIFAGLSESTPDVIEEAMIAAKKHNTVVSYDLNYRPSLWESTGGKEKSDAVNRRLKPHVDVMIGVEQGARSELKQRITGESKKFPNFKVIATTVRTVKSASLNDWGAMVLADGEFFEASEQKNLEIFDRIGGGDGFVSGLIYGFLSTGSPKKAVNYGAAHGALAMTTPGDTSMATLGEVEEIIAGSGSDIVR